MLDLALATKLVEALPDDGRLILLGDKDQLSAVETGTVFANLSATRGMSAEMRKNVEALTDETLPETEIGATQGLSDAVVWLEQGHRYARGGAIGALVGGVREGDAEAVLAFLAGRSRGEAGSEVLWQDTAPGAEPLAATLIEGYAEYLDAVQSGAPPELVLAAFERHRVLCAVREGEQGTARLNALLTEQFLARLGGPPSGASWYAGCPVLITANDYTVRVFNGDVGVALPGPGGRFLVHFPQLGGGTRPLAPSRLPEHETAFAMTTHKAQGSEFERAEVVLPARDSRVLTRELALHGAHASAHLGAPVGQSRGAPRHDHPKITASAVGSLGGVRLVRRVLCEQEIARPQSARRLTEIAPQRLQGAQRRDRRGLGVAGPAGRAVALGNRPARRHSPLPS